MDNNINYINSVNDFWEYYLYTMPQVAAELSTTHNSIHILAQYVPSNCKCDINIPVVSETQTKNEIIKLWNQGYDFSK